MRTLQILNARYPELAGRFGPPQPIPSEAERRIASISLPNRDAAVKSWLIPRGEYMGAGFVGPSGWQDAAQQGRVWSSNAAQTFSWNGSGIGGKRSLVLNGTLALLLDSLQPGGILVNPNEFSAFFVLRVDPSVTTSRYVLGTSQSGVARLPTILISSTTMTTYLGKSSGSTQDTGSYLNQDLVVGVTFSSARGVTLRRNGVVVAADPAATETMAAVTESELRLWSGSSTGNRMLGLGADAVILPTDLSAPEYATQLDYIEGAWMDYYGIVRGS